MAIEQLLERLEQDAADEQRGILDAARTRAGRIAAEAAARAERRRAEVVAPEAAKLRAAAERRLTEARRAARREVLLARQELLDRVLGEARDRLADEVDARRYRTALPVHVHEALAYLDGPARVRCPPDLVAAVRKVVRSATGTRVTADPAVGRGIVVESADGSVVVDNTLEARLGRLAPSLALEILERAGLS